MSESNYKETVRHLLNEAFRDSFCISDKDWALTDEEVDIVIDIHKDWNDKERAIERDVPFSEIVGSCFKLDTGTERPMCKGYVCYGGQAHFIKMQDALDWLNRDKHTYNTFDEAYEDNLNTDWDCYYTEWN